MHFGAALILVAGGQLDPNIGRLLRRLLERRLPFKDLIVGPDCAPDLAIDVETGVLAVDGLRLEPTAVFVRHDVFWPQKDPARADIASAALNWFYTVRGWALTNQHVRCFNRSSYMSENNKLHNLSLARASGLKTPQTRLSTLNDPVVADLAGRDVISKPVAGGSLTRRLRDETSKRNDAQHFVDHPRFIQERLLRPEIRIFGIGEKTVAFSVTSDDLDYRERHDAEIELIASPESVLDGLKGLAGNLKLDFYAADFMRAATGELIFLEINTQPMFAAFDMASDGAICDAIVGHLLPDTI